MLDDFVYGAVSRISPEAPVPVLKESHSRKMPGGAANTARNLAALGAQTRLVAIAGADEDGDILADILAVTERVDAHIIQSPHLRTVRKTRYVAGAHQLLRVDREPDITLDKDTETLLVQAIGEAATGASAIVISDYAKGTVTQKMIAEAIRAGLAVNAPIIVDPKGIDFARYGPVDLIKPNAIELSMITGLPTETDTEIEIALEKALKLCSAGALVVTRAAQGVSYLERGGHVCHKPGSPREVFDVSGAGDTSLAAFGISLSAGASLDLAAEFALAASGLAVTKAGTATVTAADLLSGGTSDILSQDTLSERIEAWRASGQSIGFTNGCFDILHPGHLKVLEEAKARCDRLIVGLNSDASVRRLKGDSRPVHDEQSRARVLSGLSAVDGVVLFEEDTPLNLIEMVKPDLLVKGGDYTEDTIIGAKEVMETGGRVHIVPLLEGHSTSFAIKRATARTDNTDH